MNNPNLAVCQQMLQALIASKDLIPSDQTEFPARPEGSAVGVCRDYGRAVAVNEMGDTFILTGFGWIEVTPQEAIAWVNGEAVETDRNISPPVDNPPIPNALATNATDVQALEPEGIYA